MTDEEFYRHPLEVLQRKLGAHGLARFLRLSRSGGSDYAREREQWPNDLARRCASVDFGEPTPREMR